MTRRPHLLFLAYAFPPSRAIGAVRCWNIAKQLARCGWDVEVVTVNPELLSDPEPGRNVVADCEREHIRLRPTDCAGRLMLGGWLKLRWWEPRLAASVVRRAVASFGIDPTVGWVRSALRACESLQPGDVDLVLASAPPYTAFWAAEKIAKRLCAPLVLDYRDLWSQNPHYGQFANKRIRQREAKLLATARGVMVISPSMADCLRAEFRSARRVAVVTNGYDTMEFSDVAPEAFDDFAVVYAGRFYPPGRTAQPLVAAVAQANTLKPPRPIRLHYYGPDRAHVDDCVRTCGAESWVVNHGSVARQKVLAALKGADAAAVITTVEPTASTAEQGILTGKLFEALGAGASVLLISPSSSDAARVVRENKLGGAFAGTEVTGMASWLAQASQVKKNGASRAEAFSWPRLGEQLDQFLRECIAAQN